MFVPCRAFCPDQEMYLFISAVRPEMGDNNYHLLSIHLYEHYLIILQSSMNSHCDPCYCVCVCLCVWEAGSRGVCPSVLSIS